MASIVNACNVLSYEILEVDPDLLEQLKVEIDAYRKVLPTGGSSYSKSQRTRLLLSRAEGLLLSRAAKDIADPKDLVQLQRSASLLQRAAAGFMEKYPDDAFDACADLTCILSKLEKEHEAARIASDAFKLLGRVSWRVDPIARNLLMLAANRGALSHVQALELKAMLRRRLTTSSCKRSA